MSASSSYSALAAFHNETSHGTIDQVDVGAKNPFALELDHFATCITENRTPHTPGEEGVQDHVVMEPIYRSVQTNPPSRCPMSRPRHDAGTAAGRRLSIAASRGRRAPRRNGADRAPLVAMIEAIQHALTKVGTYTAHSTAFLIVMVYGILWAIFDRNTLDWHAYATLATWMMTLFIQRAEHRDTQAIHAKLDELLHVHGEARNDLTRLDEEEPEKIEAYRESARAKD